MSTGITMNRTTGTPLVSVHMITYNHEAFIGRAIEGVLNQRTDFKYELVIGEDCSFDATRSECEYYELKFPDIIRLLPSVRNLGMMPNANRVTNACTGKYIALCEGDDFWTDPEKLQKQVSFLEKNPEYGMVYTDIRTVDSKGDDIEHTLFNSIRKRYSEGYIFNELLKGNFISTCSVVYRKDLIPENAGDNDRYWFVYDYWMWLRIASKCKIHFLNEVTAAYRIHDNNISRKPGFRDKRKFYYLFLDVLEAHHRENNVTLSMDDRVVIFRKLLSLLRQPYGTTSQKLKTIGMLPAYFPGFSLTFKMIFLGKA
jgi:glycosyltransferase involved in cell wall biosynthesis